MPTIAQIRIVRGFITIPGEGKPAPIALNAATISCATPIPATVPMTVPATPIPNASMEIIRRTCLPEAPIARSSASSRNRCPMVIWNTLLMITEATKAVMNAKISRPVWKNPMISPTCRSRTPRSVKSRSTISKSPPIADRHHRTDGVAMSDAVGDADVDGVDRAPRLRSGPVPCRGRGR